MKKYNIVIPTFNRVKKLKRLLDSIRRQTFKDFSITVVADNRCENTRRFLSVGNDDVVCVVNEDRQMPIRIWNKWLKENGGANLVYLCDDVELRDDCLEKADAYFKEDRVIGFKQIIEGSDLACKAAMGIIGTKFADRFINRQVFCPHYFNMCVDAELLDCAEKLNVFTFASDAILTHYHPGFYKSEMDDTHSITRTKFSEDREIREKRKKDGLVWGLNDGVVNGR